MIEIKAYRGHIRNWRDLVEELGLPDDYSREIREKLILEKAYEKWGYDVGNHLNGMFAFALYDSEKEELFCIRDHFGTKPLYYYQTKDGRLFYGTMIKDILSEKGFEKKFDKRMLQIYLSLTYLPFEDTMFEGLKKLLPGHYLIFKDGKITITGYFRPEFKIDRTKTASEVSDEIHALMGKIFTEIKEDGEVAESFLSGGVDSSYVFAMSDAKISASIGYEEERFDESKLARETAALLGKENRTSFISPEEYFDIVHEVMYHMELPLGDASAIVFSLGCKETAKHTKLCYSGEGADEFFGGYNMYRNAERYGDNLKNFYVGNTNIMKEEEKRSLLQFYEEGHEPINYVKAIYEENENLDPLSLMNLVDILIWLDGDIYLNVDKMSTAYGLEIRMPLTDKRMFELAASLPPELKITETENKLVLRMAAAKVLPEEIAFRKKLGFIVPIRIWLADERYNADVRRLFQSEIAKEFFVISELEALFEDYIGGNSDAWRKVWTVYIFLVWYEEYFIKS